MHAPRPTGGVTPGTLFRVQLAVGNSEFWKIDMSALRPARRRGRRTLRAPFPNPSVSIRRGVLNRNLLALQYAAA
jgi:hypothetical protein